MYEINRKEIGRTHSKLLITVTSGGQGRPDFLLYKFYFWIFKNESMRYLYNKKKQTNVKRNHWLGNTPYKFIEKYQIKKTELVLKMKDPGIMKN